MDAASGLCTGCGRSLDEIARWASLSDQERRGIMQILPSRLAKTLTRAANDKTAG